MHISLRVQPELLKAIDQAAEREASSRGKWIKDTLRRALVTAGTISPVESEMNALQELIEAEFAGLQESLSSLKEVRQLTESVVKLSIESVMIDRQLALQTPGTLEKAQVNAREYYSNVTRRVPSTNSNPSAGSDAS